MSRKVNSSLLNYYCAKGEIKKEVKDFLEFNDESTTYSIWWDTKISVKSKVHSARCLQKDIERANTSNLRVNLKVLEEKEENTPKRSRG